MNQKLGSISSLVGIDDVNKNPTSHAILWYLRLGHLYRDKILVLSIKYAYIPTMEHATCDVCHMSRQKRLSFPVSSTNAKNIFSMIHL